MDLRNLLAIVAVLLGSVGCGTGGPGHIRYDQPAYPSDPDAVPVVGTENFYADLLHQLGGSRLRIYSFLTDPQTDPHEYESSVGDARAVADSRLVIRNGLGYDSFMEKLLAASPDAERVVVDVQAVLALPDGSNPHVWYDPRTMPRVAAAAAAALARIDPADAATFRGNLEVLSASLNAIAERVSALRQRFAGTPVAFTEPVYGYMADALGLSVRSPAEFMKAVEQGNDPPSQAVASERDLLSGHQVRVLVYDSQTVTRVTTSLRELAASSGIPVLGVSETEPTGVDYQRWQLDTLERLEKALARR